MKDGADTIAVRGDDIVQPFLIDSNGVRGRLVRLGDAADAVLGERAYPEPVAAWR